MREVTWYAAYECNDAKGYDADYTPCASREAAMAEAARYLGFASGPRDAVYIVAVPNAMCMTGGEEWSLWDCLGEIEANGASNFVHLHRGSDYGQADIVDDLRSLADGQDDSLGSLLTRAADEIVRLRDARSVETK